MINWERWGNAPLLEHKGHRAITGDAYLQKIGDVWVMFYFGAHWEQRQGAGMEHLCLLVRFGELDRLDRRRPCKTLRRL